ncbi:hypothetical protein GG496_000432 [Candidatus Fervidibacteria bacterium JGI MDM2 JNZ-1-D12]
MLRASAVVADELGGMPMACRIFLVGQVLYPADKIFSARYKTTPYIKPVFISVRQEPNPLIFAE